MANKSNASVDIEDSALNENQPIELLDLPDVAIKKILRNLDLHTLKKLRLVSKSTKGWVEQTEFLQKFKINISSIERQDELTNSSEVSWNNFVITFERDGPFEKINPEFAEKFGPFIKHLVINNEGLVDVFNTILRSLIVNPNIETLCIEKVILESEWLVKGAPFWMMNLKKLKKLKIENTPYFFLLNYPGHICKSKALFDLLLQSCPNLTHLHLPMLLRFDTKDDAISNELHSQVVLSPLLNYLNRIHNSGRRINLTVDLDGFKYDGWNRKLFPITLDGLLELSKMCAKTGTKLNNVTTRALADRTNVQQVNWNTLKEVISSVKMLNDPAGLRGIYLPPNIKVYVEILALLLNANYSSFELQEPIHSIHFSSYHFPILENLYSNLFQVTRPSVQEFKCDWQIGDMWGEGDEQAIWSGIDITTSFPNLKYLHLEQWGFSGEGADFSVLLTGLILLERLYLKNCYMNEEGLLGPDTNNPLVVQLKSLVHLEFIDTNMTDLHMRNAFRHMRLKTFVLKCERPLTAYHCSKVTFKSGISTLCSIGGGFGDTIEHFEISIPHDCAKEEMDVYVNQFKNLHTYKTFKHCPQREVSDSEPEKSSLESQESPNA